MEKITLRQIAQIKGAYESSNRVYSIDGLCPTINTCGGGNLEPKIMEVMEPKAIGTLTTDGSSPKHNNRVIEPTKLSIQNYRIRKLTPPECWRLMGFDDEDFKKAKAAGISDSQLYKQAGNSIVVAVLEAIFKQML